MLEHRDSQRPCQAIQIMKKQDTARAESSAAVNKKQSQNLWDRFQRQSLAMADTLDRVIKDSTDKVDRARLIKMRKALVAFVQAACDKPVRKRVSN
jgi:hypothetical protein